MTYSIRWKSGHRKLKDIQKIFTLFHFIISVRTPRYYIVISSKIGPMEKDVNANQSRSIFLVKEKKKGQVDGSLGNVENNLITNLVFSLA